MATMNSLSKIRKLEALGLTDEQILEVLVLFEGQPIEGVPNWAVQPQPVQSTKKSGGKKAQAFDKPVPPAIIALISKDLDLGRKGVKSWNDIEKDWNGVSGKALSVATRTGVTCESILDKLTKAAEGLTVIKSNAKAKKTA